MSVNTKSHASHSDADGEENTLDQRLQTLKEIVLNYLEREKKADVKSLQSALNMEVADLNLVMNSLLEERRVEAVSHPSGLEFVWQSEEYAHQRTGLNNDELMVLNVIEKSFNMGIWIKTLKTKTRFQQKQLTKILLKLEKRKLIKSVKSVAYKSRKMYMLYGVEPAKQLTGGVWFNEQALDDDKIIMARMFIGEQLAKSPNGMTCNELCEAMRGSDHVLINRLDHEPIFQLLEVMTFEGKITYKEYYSDLSNSMSRLSHYLFPGAGKGIIPQLNSFTGVVSTHWAPVKKSSKSDTSNVTFEALTFGGTTGGFFGTAGAGVARRAGYTAAFSQGQTFHLFPGVNTHAGVNARFSDSGVPHSQAMKAVANSSQFDFTTRDMGDEVLVGTGVNQSNTNLGDFSEQITGTSNSRRRSSAPAKRAREDSDDEGNGSASENEEEEKKYEELQNLYNNRLYKLVLPNTTVPKDKHGLSYKSHAFLGYGAKNISTFTEMNKSPCTLCPVSDECAPYGKINPASCEYYENWLDF